MDIDELVRGVAERQARNAKSAARLIDQPEDALYALLATTVVETASISSANDDQFRSSGVNDLLRSPDALTLGRRIFLRWARSLHDFLCGPSDDDKKLREQILRAIFNKEAGSVAIVAGGLVAAFGLSAALAAIVAALVVKLIFAPALDEVCKAWEEALSPKSQ